MDRSRGIIIGFIFGILALAGLFAGGFFFLRNQAPSSSSFSSSSPSAAGTGMVALSGTPPLICVHDSLDLFGRMPDKSRAELAASLLDGVTRDIFTEYLAYRKDPSSQAHAKKLQELASQRKKLLVETLQRNPDAAFRSALSKEEQDVLASLTQNCVEMPGTAEGKFMIHHADMLDGSDQNDYYLVASDGKQVILHPAFGLKFAVPEGNRTVRVSGLRIDDRVFFDGNDPSSFISVDKLQSFWGADAHAALTNLGPQRVAVILANFQDTTQPSLTAAQVQTTVFTNVNNYYIENSYNKISLTGAVFGWYTIPLNQTCNDTTTTAAAIATADPFINYTQYDRVIVVAPMGPGCSYSGIAMIGGGSTFSTAEGPRLLSTNVIVAAYGTDDTVYDHELGHNFGVHHANFYNCGSNSMSGTCTSTEYGSLYSVMGNNHSGPRQMNAPEKRILGWLGASNVLDVTANGTYTLVPLETTTAALQALRVERNSYWSSNGGLYLEYRQPLGVDSNIIGTDAFTGPLINTQAYDAAQSQLIDPTPPADPSTAALTPGTTLTDPATGDTFTTTAANAAGATVNVTLCKTDFTAPTVSMTAPASGATVSGVITVSANATDASGIQKVEFYATSSTPFATATTFPYTATLDTTLLPNGIAGVWAWAYDLSGQGCGSGVSGNIGYAPYTTFTVLNTGDTIPPTVSLTAPANGATLTYPFTVSANASDNIGVYKVEFYLDAATTPFFTRPIPPYSFSVNSGFLVPTGFHTLYAKAYDLQLNTATSSVISLTVNGTDTTPPNISITAPANNAVVSGTIAVSANATDNIGVTKVEFYTDANTMPFATVTGGGPYATTLDTTTLTAGAHTISAKAYDAAGNVGTGVGCAACLTYTPALVSITVDNTPPTVSLTAPANGATVSGTAVGLSAMASDNIAVQHVDFYRDGTVLLGTDLTSPYGFIWDSTGVANGSHTLFAKAVDTAGNATNSSSIAVTVSNGTGTSSADTTPPTVPAGLAALTISSSQISLSWSPSTDNVGVAGYHIYKNGSPSFFATVTGTSYSDTGLSPSTTYAYAVAAFDAAGNVSAKSASVSATTNAASSSSSSSSSGGPISVSGTIDIAVAVTQAVPVTKVEFYTDTTSVPFVTVSAAPYAAKLDTTTLTPGAHTVKARIYYANGQISATSGIGIIVP